MYEQDIARIKFKMGFGRISYMHSSTDYSAKRLRHQNINLKIEAFGGMSEYLQPIRLGWCKHLSMP